MVAYMTGNILQLCKNYSLIDFMEENSLGLEMQLIFKYVKEVLEEILDMICSLTSQGIEDILLDRNERDC